MRYVIEKVIRTYRIRPFLSRRPTKKIITEARQTARFVPPPRGFFVVSNYLPEFGSGIAIVFCFTTPRNVSKVRSRTRVEKKNPPSGLDFPNRFRPGRATAKRPLIILFVFAGVQHAPPRVCRIPARRYHV